MSNTTAQLPLFSLEGKNVAKREAIRAIATNATYLYKVKLQKIRIRPDNFNARIKPAAMSVEAWHLVLMIPDLADKIYANNGPATTIIGDFHIDGFFYQTDGERRILALNHLLATGRDTYPNGEKVEDVMVQMNPPGTTDLERKKKMHDANDTLLFTTMQKAHDFFRLTQEPYSLTQEKIAELWKLSRQTVGNYIQAATELPQDIQDKIDTGEVKITVALAELRKERATERKGGDKNNEEDQPLITGALAEKQAQEEKDKEKLRGDEEEFDQEDNSKTFTGSKSLPEDRSSGEIVLGTNSIYMHAQKKNCIKQFVNRYEHLMNKASKLILPELPGDEEDEERAALLFSKREAHVIDQLINEYDITVK